MINYLQKLSQQPFNWWWFQLQDVTLQLEFRDFSLKQQSSLYPIAAAIAFLFMLILFIGMTVISTQNPSAFTWSILVCVTSVFTVWFGFSIGFLHYRIGNLNKVSVHSPSKLNKVDKIVSRTPSKVQISDHNREPLSKRSMFSFAQSLRSVSHAQNNNEVDNQDDTGKRTALEDSEESIDDKHIDKPYDGDNTIAIRTSKYFERLYKLNHYFFLSFQAFIIAYTIRRSEGDICVGLFDTHSYEHYSHPSDPEHIAPFQQMLNYFFCGNVLENGLLPIDVHLLLVIGPIITTVIFPSVNVKYVWLQMISSMIVFIVVSILMEQIPSGLFLITWLLTDIFVIGQLQLDKINHFYVHLRLMELFEENERNNEAIHVNEMRYLIANMAHDLKTVSIALSLSYMNCQLIDVFSLSFLATDVIYISNFFIRNVYARIRTIY